MADPCGIDAVDRDEKGRFGTGNAIGRAGRIRKPADKFQAILEEELTADDWRAMVRKQIANALKGNIKAFNTIADRTLGKAVQRMDISRTATSEVAVYLMAQAGANLGYDISPYRNLAEQAERIGGLLEADGGEVDGDWKLSERADGAEARESVVIAGESKREEQVREEERKEKVGEEQEEQEQ